MLKNLKFLIISALSLNAFADFNVNQSLGLPPVQMELKCEHKFELIRSAFRARKGDYITCKDVQWVENSFQKVKNLTPIAPKLSVEIYSRSNQASFDIGQTIRISLQMTHANRWGEIYLGYPRGTDSILYHEYAHAVFTQLIGKKYYPSLHRDALRASLSRVKLQQLWAKGNPNNSTKFYIDQLRILNEKLKSHPEIKIHHMTSSYNEFFADLVAVLVTNDKNTIMNSLYYDQITDQKYEMIKLRSFRDQGTSYTNKNLFEEHGELALVRQFIGEEILPDIFNAENEVELKRQLLLDVLQAIDNQISQRLKNGQLKYSPSTSNPNLIEEIKKIRQE